MYPVLRHSVLPKVPQLLRQHTQNSDPHSIRVLHLLKLGRLEDAKRVFLQSKITNNDTATTLIRKLALQPASQATPKNLALTHDIFNQCMEVYKHSTNNSPPDRKLLRVLLEASTQLENSSTVVELVRELVFFRRLVPADSALLNSLVKASIGVTDGEKCVF